MRHLALALLMAALAGTAAADTTLVFDIDLRAEIAAGRFDPARDRVGLRGGAAPLSWDRPLLADPAPSPGRYALRLTLPDDAAGGQPLA